MTREQFESVRVRRHNLKGKVGATKATEYAPGDDRLHNFKQAAMTLKCTPAQACLYFMTKHWVSIVDAVQLNQPITQAWIDEKIGDLSLYADLLEACLTEVIADKDESHAVINGIVPVPVEYHQWTKDEIDLFCQQNRMPYEINEILRRKSDPPFVCGGVQTYIKNDEQDADLNGAKPNASKSNE